MVLALCTFSDDRLSNTFRDIFIAKIKKGSNSVNTGDRVGVRASCNSLMALCVSSSIKLPSILLGIGFGQKCDGRRSDGRTKRRLYALPSGSIKIE